MRTKDNELSRLSMGLIGLLLTLLGWSINRGIVAIEGEILSLQEKERNNFARLQAIENEIKFLRKRKQQGF